MTQVLTRRSMLGHGAVALAGGAAIALVVPDMDARATVADPLLAFLDEWESKMAVLPTMTDRESDAYYPEHVQPFQDRVSNGDIPCATTVAGAAAALRRALVDDCMDDMDANLVKAALAFLDGLA